tara:strand:- start:9006 stop:10559 length:1554 start_codon:yes stop_codon:yes gene_type:complete
MLSFFNKRFFIIFLFPILLGGFTTLSFQPFNLFFLNFISLPLLFYSIIYVKKKSKSVYRKKPFLKNLFILGTSYGFGFFFFGIFWIANSLTFDDSFKYLIPFSLILIPLFLSLFFSLPILLIGNYCEKNISSIFLISLAFSLSDFIRDKILTGFPWNIWSYSFSWSVETLQILHFIGIFSLNILIITIFFLPSILFMKNNHKYFFLSFFIILIFVNYFYGSYKVNSSTQTDNVNKVNFKIVTAGMNLSDFKNEFDVASKLSKYSDPQKDKSTIFVWPEGVFLNNNFNENNDVKKLFEETFSKNHLIILGANTLKITSSGEEYYNSMLIVDKNLKLISQYDKKKLVPFGEFLPFERFLNYIGLKKITPGYSSFSKGTGATLINLKFDEKNINILPLICYEIIFPSLTEKYNKYNFIINISEDAWFGKSIGPYQHFAKAIFRSIESGVYTIRSANMGISAFISPQGKILKNLQPDEIGNIELSVPIYEKNKNIIKKDLIFLLLLITYIVTFFVLRKFKI